MNRFRKKEDAVSPVIATILMVAITVVLAGVLVVYLQTLPQGGGTVSTPLGGRIQKTTEGNWTLSITTGDGKNAGDVTLQVINPTTGAKTLSAKINSAINLQWSWYNNDGDTKLSVGDTILLNQTTGVIAAGFNVQLMVGSSIITGPITLPS